MYILAIEQSTPLCSIVLTRDGERLAGTSWEDTQLRNQQIFSILPDLLNMAPGGAAGINLFALGLGPGSFSGLRCALAAIQGLALPDKKEVFGLSSAEILAWQLMNEENSNDITILGDARRGFVWVAGFSRKSGHPERKKQVALVPAGELATVLNGSDTVATSDWDRIGELIKTSAPSGCRVVDRRCIPNADTAAALTLTKCRLHLPSEPLLPIYLHPPVSIAPKYS